MSAAPDASRTYSRRSLHGQVAHDIGTRILNGELAPGQVLPNEATLSAELKVSRTALREAIKVLAAKGLVESRPKTGTRVREREAWNLLDPDILSWLYSAGPNRSAATALFEVREIFEPQAAAMAASRASPEQINLIAEAYADMEAVGDDIEAGIRPDLRFHQNILSATGNELLRSLGAMIETALAASFKVSSSRPAVQRNALDLHKNVLDAIAAGEPDRARDGMTALLKEARDGVIEYVSDDS